ncbi:MAG: endopeptidase La, partial [Paramuribaculum sp.]|nr:endopeptidase La [Paramuribaculum sp.]
ISPAEKIEMLGLYRMKDRAFALLTALSRVSDLAGMVNQIKEKTSQALSEQQRSAFLQQQLEIIRQELYGAQSDDSSNLRERAAEVKLTDDARKMFNRELDKLQRLNPQNPDYMVVYNYLDHLLSLPWGEYSPLPEGNVADARACLEKDHYGLEKVKERIVEQLAVMLNNPEGNSPIICLVGPPGVGKTSLGKSIAAALGRKYQRVSLGGMHDESELRGHRRTYIGAMPGRIIDAIHRAGTANPVLLLDEIDKMSSDYKGDPAAAMLEVLDPEQNSRFHDNYTDVDFDLSKVLFITTANTLSTIQQPLLDRMEVIDISGYLLEEKVEIARRHLLPRLLGQLNFENSGFEISDSALEALIEGYTSESGVRQLEKQLASLVRKAILAKMSETDFPTPVEPSDLEKLLGVAPYTRDRYEGNDYPGVATGLAWTPVGGEILYVETSLAPGKEGLTLTGSLGNVMKESASIALQYVKAHAEQLGIEAKKLENNAVAIHVPEGAIPKDGPSAGVTMITSIVSALTGRKVTAGIAMTGEITLRGKVLAVGGIKEKILAAKRAGISTIVLPAQNRRNIAEIPERYVKDMTFHFVDNIT